MKPPRSGVLTGWGIVCHSRRGTSFIRCNLRSGYVFRTRAEARERAALIRCPGMAATPIRVRVTIEAKENEI